MNPIYIGLGVVIVVLLYYLYVSLTSGVTTLASILDCSSASTVIDGSKISNPTSVSFAYGLWLYVRDWSTTETNTNNLTNVFYRAGLTSGYSLHVYLENSSPYLYAQFSPATDGISFQKNSTNTSYTLDTEVLITSTLPLQKWVYLTVSVDGGTYLDIYLDGKMVKTSILTQTITCEGTSTSSSTIPGIVVGPFAGYITTFQSWGYALDPQTVWTYYMKGNGTSLGTTYNMDVTLSQNSQSAGSFRLF